MVEFKFKAFLDTNVLIDVLCAPRRPSAEASAAIFQAIRSGYLEGVITTQSILDAAYILSRTAHPYNPELFGRSILSIMNYVNVDSIHFLDVRDAILHPGGDLEDDAQFVHAEAEGCDAVITSDRQFRLQKETSGVPFFTPDEFLARLRGQAYSFRKDETTI